MINAEDIVSPIESTVLTILKDYWGALCGFGIMLYSIFEVRSQQKENMKDIVALKVDLKEHCTESKESLEAVENKIGLRITDVERNQDKLLELIYREQKSQSSELASLKDLLNDVRASANKTEGYLQAQKEFNIRHDKA